MIRYNGKDITPRFGGANLSRVMYNNLQIWPADNNIYLIYSDIEGAEVVFDGEIKGTIQDGVCSVTVRRNEDDGSHSVLVQNGTLPSKESEYKLSSTIGTTTTVNATGGSYSNFITETTINYVADYPQGGTINNGETLTLNTVFTPITSESSVGSYQVSENQTTNARSYQYTYTHRNSSDTKITITFNQQAGTLYTYLVNSDCEGCTASFNGIGTATITDGQAIQSRWNNNSSVEVTITGTPPAAGNWEYEFDITTLGGTSLGTSDIYNTDSDAKSNLTIGATSRRRRIEYSLPAKATCNANSSITMNSVSAYSSYEAVSYSGTSNQTWCTIDSSNRVSISANTSTSSDRSATITWTQSNSNLTDTVTINQERVTVFTYTINSNCNGGTVYFNNVSKGTISNGKLEFTDEASSGTVRISGGVPSNTSTNVNTGYDYDTDTEYRTTSGGSSSSSSFQIDGWGTDWDHDTYNNPVDSDGRSYDVNITSYTSTTSTTNYQSRSVSLRRYHYQVQTTTYTAPANKTVNGNSSTTMNYTSSTSTGSTQYNDWEEYSYGSWSTYDTSTSTSTSGVTPTISTRSNCSCSLKSSNSSTGEYVYTVTVSSNTTTSNRSWSCKWTRSGQSTLTFHGTQYHRDYSTFEFYGGGTTKSVTLSGEYGDINGSLLTAVSLAHIEDDELYTSFSVNSKSDWLNVGGYQDAGNYSGINGAALIKFGATGANPSTSARTGYITFKQTYYDQKTITINVTQNGVSQTYSVDSIGWISGGTNQSTSTSKQIYVNCPYTATTIQILVKCSVNAGSFSWSNVTVTPSSGITTSWTNQVGSQATLVINVPQNTSTTSAVQRSVVIRAGSTQCYVSINQSRRS